MQKLCQQIWQGCIRKYFLFFFFFILKWYISNSIKYKWYLTLTLKPNSTLTLIYTAFPCSVYVIAKTIFSLGWKYLCFYIDLWEIKGMFTGKIVRLKLPQTASCQGRLIIRGIWRYDSLKNRTKHSSVTVKEDIATVQKVWLSQNSTKS